MNVVPARSSERSEGSAVGFGDNPSAGMTAYPAAVFCGPNAAIEILELAESELEPGPGR